MKTKSLAVMLAMLPLAACMTSPPPPPVPSAALDRMSCRELAAAKQSASSDSAWARRQQRQTFAGTTPMDAGTLNLPLAGSASAVSPNTVRASDQAAAISAAMARRGCP